MQINHETAVLVGRQAWQGAKQGVKRSEFVRLAAEAGQLELVAVAIGEGVSVKLSRDAKKAWTAGWRITLKRVTRETEDASQHLAFSIDGANVVVTWADVKEDDSDPIAKLIERISKLEGGDVRRIAEALAGMLS